MNFLRRDMDVKTNRRLSGKTVGAICVAKIRGCASSCIALLVIFAFVATSGAATAHADVAAKALAPVPKPINLSIEGAYAAFDKSPGGVLSAMEEKKDYANYSSALRDYSRLIKTGGRDTYEADKLRLSRDYLYDMIDRNKKARETNNKMQTYEMYFSYKQAKKDIIAAEKSLAIAEKQARIEQLKYNAGLISKVELLKAQTSLSSSKKQLDSTKTNMDAMKRKFNLYMGFDPAQEVRLTTEITIRSLPSKKPAEIIAEAQKNGIAMAGAGYQLEQAKVAFSEVGDYPHDSAAYINAKNSLEIAENNMRNKPTAIEMDVQDKYNEMMRSYEAIAEKKEALVRARDALRIAQAAFKAGMNVKTDVQGAELAVFTGEAEITKAIVEYNAAAIKYEMAGIIDTKN